MALTKTIEGSWDDLVSHADELRTVQRLRLVIPGEFNEGRFRADLTPEERIRLLDELAATTRDLPPLPAAAFERESLYSDDPNA